MEKEDTKEATAYSIIRQIKRRHKQPKSPKWENRRLKSQLIITCRIKKCVKDD